MKQNVFLLGFKAFNFVNDSNERVSGVTVSYVTDFMDDGSSFGFLPIQQTVPYELLESLKQTGVYEFDFSMTVGSGNKPKISIVSAKCLKGVSLSEFINLK